MYFRRDLRIEDNTALLNSDYKLIPVFIFDPKQVGDNPYKSDAAISFMVQSLSELAEEIPMNFFYGDPLQVMKEITKTFGTNTVIFNKDYTPYALERDNAIIKEFDCECYDDVLLIDNLLDEDQKRYKKFSAFLKKHKDDKIRKPARKVNDWSDMRSAKCKHRIDLDIIDEKMGEVNKPIVRGGRKEGLELLKNLPKRYDDCRDMLAFSTSHLSAHNKFGTISIREFYDTISKDRSSGDKSLLVEQLLWRDFYYVIMYDDPNALKGPYYDKFKGYWTHSSTSQKRFDAWCKGKTGYPVVDACMRQLNEEHYIHNRGRLIVADFLIKLLGVDWRKGEKYFAQQLVDYDPAQNNYNWQWVAGTGPHSQPYFRVFNPMSQSKKYDPDCEYIKRWLPELRDVAPKDIHKMNLSSLYSKPIVDYEKAKDEYLKSIKAHLDSVDGNAETRPFLVFPNQLFRDIDEIVVPYIILVEDDTYFTKYRFHKNKLVLHRASMKYYADYLKDQGLSVEYWNSADMKNFDYDGEYVAYNPVDIDVMNLYKNVEWLETPYFLTSEKELRDYNQYEKGNKRYNHDARFYRWQRKRLNVLIEGDDPAGGKWTYDSENRKTFEECGVKADPIKLKPKQNKYVEEAKEYVMKHFANNPGDIHLVFPTTHKEAEGVLSLFLDKKLAGFGPTQDATSPDIVFGYHSQISSSLNNGLLTPRYVLDQVIKHHKKLRDSDSEIPMNSLEGFLRQLIGWREYCRLIYLEYMDNPELKKNNHFGFTRKLNDRWWDGTTGIIYVDYLIEKALKYAYLTHIERLMYIAAFMLICEIDPAEVYRWFIEIVSIDAYDWVMAPNVYGMGSYADGGLMMTRPYYSSSKYVSKMSGLKDNKSDKIWNSLYYTFMDKNKDKLNDYRSLQWISNLEKKSDEEIEEMRKIAEDFMLNE